jgi:hypothetical protein
MQPATVTRDVGLQVGLQVAARPSAAAGMAAPRKSPAELWAEIAKKDADNGKPYAGQKRAPLPSQESSLMMAGVEPARAGDRGGYGGRSSAGRGGREAGAAFQGRGRGGRGRGGGGDRACYNCGKPGHESRDCEAQTNAHVQPVRTDSPH